MANMQVQTAQSPFVSEHPVYKEMQSHLGKLKIALLELIRFSPKPPQKNWAELCAQFSDVSLKGRVHEWWPGDLTARRAKELWFSIYGKMEDRNTVNHRIVISYLDRFDQYADLLRKEDRERAHDAAYLECRRLAETFWPKDLTYATAKEHFAQHSKDYEPLQRKICVSDPPDDRDQEDLRKQYMKLFVSLNSPEDWSDEFNGAIATIYAIFEAKGKLTLINASLNP